MISVYSTNTMSFGFTGRLWTHYVSGPGRITTVPNRLRMAAPAGSRIIVLLPWLQGQLLGPAAEVSVPKRGDEKIILWLRRLQGRAGGRPWSRSRKGDCWWPRSKRSRPSSPPAAPLPVEPVSAVATAALPVQPLPCSAPV